MRTTLNLTFNSFGGSEKKAFYCTPAGDEVISIQATKSNPNNSKNFEICCHPEVLDHRVRVKPVWRDGISEADLQQLADLVRTQPRLLRPTTTTTTTTTTTCPPKQLERPPNAQQHDDQYNDQHDDHHDDQHDDDHDDHGDAESIVKGLDKMGLAETFPPPTASDVAYCSVSVKHPQELHQLFVPDPTQTSVAKREIILCCVQNAIKVRSSSRTRGSIVWEIKFVNLNVDIQPRVDVQTHTHNTVVQVLKSLCSVNKTAIMMLFGVNMMVDSVQGSIENDGSEIVKSLRMHITHIDEQEAHVENQRIMEIIDCIDIERTIAQLYVWVADIVKANLTREQHRQRTQHQEKQERAPSPLQIHPSKNKHRVKRKPDFLAKVQSTPYAQRSASSTHGDNPHGIGFGRGILNSTQGWSAKDNQPDQWYELNLGRDMCVCGIVLQGREDYAQHVTELTVFVDGVPIEAFGALENATQRLLFRDGSVVGRKVRLSKFLWHNHLSLRVEVLAYEISLVAIDTNQHHHLPEPCTQPSSTVETSLPSVEATHMGWQDVGSLEDLEANIVNFPLTTYDLGVQYNSGLGAIHNVTVNSWNRGIRVTVDDMYPQGNDGSTMALGTAVFVKGTDDSMEMWTHYYYHQAASGKYVCGNSNGEQNQVRVHAKLREHPWVHVGVLADIEKITSTTHPLNKYQLGIQYNHSLGSIHAVMVNSWTKGIRVSTTTYPQGDNGKTLVFGKAMFVKGTTDSPDQFKHYYYQQNAAGKFVQILSNDNKTVRLFACLL